MLGLPSIICDIWRQKQKHGLCTIPAELKIILNYLLVKRMKTLYKSDKIHLGVESIFIAKRVN